MWWPLLPSALREAVRARVRRVEEWVHARMYTHTMYNIALSHSGQLLFVELGRAGAHCAGSATYRRNGFWLLWPCLTDPVCPC